MKTVVTALMLVAALAWAAESEAKRVGGGRTSGTSRDAAKPKQKTEDVKETKESSGPSVRVRVNQSSLSSSQPLGVMRTAVPQPGSSVAAPAVAGAAAGSAAGLSEEELRRRNEERLRQAAEKEEKERAQKEKREQALADWERRQAEERKRQEKAREEREAKARQAEQQAQCVFKPVMSDEDIAKCRQVRR